MRPLATALASCVGLTSWRPWPSERISTGRPLLAMSWPTLAGALAASSLAAPALRR